MKHHHHHNLTSSSSDVAVSSSSATSSSSDHTPPILTHSTSSSPRPHHRATSSSHSSDKDTKPPATQEEYRGGGAVSAAAETVVVEKRGEYSALCKWTIVNFSRIKARAVWSKYFEVGGYDCRLLVYPKGDSQALPSHISIYLQIMDPRNNSSKWDCFASYRLAIENPNDSSKSVHRDSWHRFSSKKKSHGWCDFTPSNSILEPKLGFLFNNDCVLITADILILHESVSFSRDSNNEMQSSCGSNVVVTGPTGDVLSGKFTWKVHNFSLFRDMIKTQKIMSPVFPSGECNLRISVYQSTVNGVEYLSMCLESKDTDKGVGVSDRSCWCLFRMSVLNQMPGMNHMHRDSYGRFAADNKSGDNTSLGWNDYMKMFDFITPESGFLVDDTAVFSTSFHVIKELSSFSKNGGFVGGRIGNGGVKKADGHSGKFTWRIENFTRLKDLLKKRKITGLCIKSRRFQIGNRDCRLIVYPRGQSQPPCHLSVFLEVTDSRNTSSDWSCFVSHRLSVVNQRMEEKSVSKESQNRYSKAAKDWGWREFVTLTSLFDQDSGFLVQDTVVFSAEVLILKETSVMQELTDQNSVTGDAGSQLEKVGKRSSFTWKVENFLAFKEIMETRKIFSKFFQAGGCELRIGVYESFDTICIYLESDQSTCNDPEKNFWVKYRMAIVNQKNSSRTVWKESSICTKTWNNSVLQFMKVSDMLESDAGFLVRDTVIFVCEILDCCPWFEFADLEEMLISEEVSHLRACHMFMMGKKRQKEARGCTFLFVEELLHHVVLVLASEDDQDALTTDPDELIDSEDSELISGDEEDIFRNLLSRAGFHLSYGDNSSQPQVTLREKLLMDAGAIAGFLTGLRVYLDDPAKVKRLLLPAKISGSIALKNDNRSDESSPSLMNLLMGVKVLQQAIIDLLLDIMVECCQPSEGTSNDDSSGDSSTSLDGSGTTCPVQSDRGDGSPELVQIPVYDRLDSVVPDNMNMSAVQSSDMNLSDVPPRTAPRGPVCPPETSASGSVENPSLNPKTKWPEQSEELLGLIVNSLRALDGVVPQGCPEPRRRPQSARKIALVLDKAPKHLKSDLVSLVPKLVEHSEHPLAASALLDRLQMPDAEPGLRIPVFDALSQLECSSDVWERVLSRSLELLPDSNDEPLAATIDFIFKAALLSHHLPEAVRSIRIRLKNLGIEVPPYVLNYLTQTMNSCEDIAQVYLRDIDHDVCAIDCFIRPGVNLSVDHLSNSEGVNAMNKQALHTCYFSDIYVLIDMLSIPCLAVEASQTFERAVAQGAIVAQSVAVILERRLARRLTLTTQHVAEDFQHVDAVDGEILELRAQRDDFTSVLGLAETLTLSKDPHVKQFVKMLYSLLFKWYADESYRLRMLKRLVDRAISSSDTSIEANLDMEILVILVSEEQKIVKPVLSMMREVAEQANVDRAALWHQLCASEDEVLRLREERKIELADKAKEKTVMSQRLHESEAANSRLKCDMKAEADRYGREKKDLMEHMQELESQLEWLRSERDDETKKLIAEKKSLHDRLHDAETQISQLKSRKRDELKKVMKEKNLLAERLKNGEAARKRFDEELKRHATENVTREEIRQSLEDEVRRLTFTVGHTENEKREKEEQVTRCEAYIDGMESKLQTCQQYIRSLENSLHEEMTRHAPLYGVGLDSLSLKELDTLARIHEDGLRQILSIQQLKGNPAGSPLVIPHHIPQNLSQSRTMFHAAPPPMAVGLPPSLMSNSDGHQANGHVNGGLEHWFSHS
ncbi:hypothetical protein Leryth_014735 [Lithospermum erythrorhizon]|nr:hypothetical protein Leryth_014735 [Lithospermum erythrorhizon]